MREKEEMRKRLRIEVWKGCLQGSNGEGSLGKWGCLKVDKVFSLIPVILSNMGCVYLHENYPVHL